VRGEEIPGIKPDRNWKKRGIGSRNSGNGIELILGISDIVGN